MQLIIYRIFMILLDKKLFFCLPPPKKSHHFIASKQCHFLGFHLRKQRKGGGVKKQPVWRGGVEERMKGEIVDYILLKCYLKWTPNTNAAWFTWLKLFGVELHIIYFRSCETTPDLKYQKGITFKNAWNIKRILYKSHSGIAPKTETQKNTIQKSLGTSA